MLTRQAWVAYAGVAIYPVHTAGVRRTWVARTLIDVDAAIRASCSWKMNHQDATIDLELRQCTLVVWICIG